MSSREAIGRVAAALGARLPEVVFVGASAASLYEIGPRTTYLRPTLDVDIVTRATSKAQYDQLITDLRRRGVLRDPDTHEDVPLCRYYVDGVTTDIVAAREEVLGFTNRWFDQACRNALEIELADGLVVEVISPIYFVASKLWAFRSPDRLGHDDFLASHDIEDVIQVLFGVEALEADIRDGCEAVHDFVRHELRRCLENEDFHYAVESHFGFSPAGVDPEQLLSDLRALISRESDGS